MESILKALVDINRHVEPIAQRNPAGSDLHVVAYAIHNLTLCVEDLAHHPICVQNHEEP